MRLRFLRGALKVPHSSAKPSWTSNSRCAFIPRHSSAMAKTSFIDVIPKSLIGIDVSLIAFGFMSDCPINLNALEILTRKGLDVTASQSGIMSSQEMSGNFQTGVQINCVEICNLVSQLERIREQEGLTRAHLARLAGIAERTLYRIERENGVTRESTKNRLIQGLNKNPHATKRWQYKDVW